MLRIVFMGSDAIALPALNWFAGEGREIGEIAAVFTQPDRAVGRGQKVQPNEIKLWAQARESSPIELRTLGFENVLLDAEDSDWGECETFSVFSPYLAWSVFIHGEHHVQ